MRHVRSMSLPLLSVSSTAAFTQDILRIAPRSGRLSYPMAAMPTVQPKPKTAWRCAYPQCGACPVFSPLHVSPALRTAPIHRTLPFPLTLHYHAFAYRHCHRASMHGDNTEHPCRTDTAMHIPQISKGGGNAPLVARAMGAKSQRGEKFPLLTPLTAFYISFYDFQPLENRKKM